MPLSTEPKTFLKNILRKRAEQLDKAKVVMKVKTMKVRSNTHVEKVYVVSPFDKQLFKTITGRGFNSKSGDDFKELQDILRIKYGGRAGINLRQLEEQRLRRQG